MAWLRKHWALLLACLACVLLGVVGTIFMMAAGWFDPEPILPERVWGRFPHAAKAELLDDGRRLKLLADFAYVDPRGKIWLAEKSHIVDGASIPRPFWTITGGPLEGRYRNASIVHDVACDQMKEPWQAVHLMFYEACRCGGVQEKQGKILYAAVYHFGPRWETRKELKKITEKGVKDKAEGKTIEVEVKHRLEPATPPPNAEKLLERLINERNPSLQEIERLDPTKL